MCSFTFSAAPDTPAFRDDGTYTQSSILLHEHGKTFQVASKHIEAQKDKHGSP